MERWESCICQKLCKFFALNFVWQNVGSSDDVSRISQNFDRRKTWLCCVIEEGKLFILLQKVWERFVTCEGILQQQWLLWHFLQMLFIHVLFGTTIPKHPRCFIRVPYWESLRLCMGAGTVMGVAIFNHIEWNVKIEQIMEVNFARFIPPPNIRGMGREF